MDNTSRYTYNIVEVLKDMITKIGGATKVFVSTDRPTASDQQRNEMIIVGLPFSIRHHGVYQSAYFKVEIIVKDKAQGISNITQLENLTNIVQKLFPMSSKDNRYNATTPKLVFTGRDGLGYTIWNLQGSVSVNKIDSYKFV